MKKEYAVILNKDYIEFRGNKFNNCYCVDSIDLETFNDLESAIEYAKKYKFEKGLEECKCYSIGHKEYYGEWLEIRELIDDELEEDSLYDKYSYEIKNNCCERI